MMHNWLSHNQLSLNVDEPVVITFGAYTDSVPRTVKIIIQDRTLKRVTVFNLGVLIDYRLRWQKHILETTKKLRYLLYVFHKLKYYMNSNILKIIYYAFFHSVETYELIR